MNKPHKRLDAWATAVDLAQLVYKTTDQFPTKEQFGLASQVRRAAVSIPSNIAEGARTHHDLWQHTSRDQLRA